MKKIRSLLLCLATWVLCLAHMNAQDGITERDSIRMAEEDEGPIMYKFEPDFLTSMEERKQRIERTRAILDTLDISERRRRKLLKDLYKNGITKRLSKALLVDTKFEDIED